MLQLVFRSLFWYLRTHLLVLLAVAVSTAVIGGSLIVGDSIRASLRQMTLNRLGGISHVINSPRFIREDLASEIIAHAKDNAPNIQAAPALVLTGSIEKQNPDGSLSRAAGVSLTGLQPADWTLLNTSNTPAPTDSEIVLGARTAQELNAKPGDRITIWVEIPSSIPRDSLLGERESISAELQLTVAAVLTEQTGASRFSLHAAQQLPHTAFLSLRTFQERLKLEPLEASRRNPTSRPGRVNSILLGQSADDARLTLNTQSTSDILNSDNARAEEA